MSLDIKSIQDKLIRRGGSALPNLMLPALRDLLKSMSNIRAGADCPGHAAFNENGPMSIGDYDPIATNMKAKTCDCQSVTVGCTCNSDSCTCDNDSSVTCSCNDDFYCGTDSWNGQGHWQNISANFCTVVDCNCHGVSCHCDSRIASCHCNADSFCNCDSYYNTLLSD